MNRHFAFYEMPQVTVEKIQNLQHQKLWYFLSHENKILWSISAKVVYEENWYKMK